MRTAASQQLERLVRPGPRIAEVARACGVSPTAVRYWIDGRSVPSERHRATLAATFAIPVEDWINGQKHA
jgi:hypothetical protein